MFIAEIDGKEVELKPDQIKAKGEGFGVLTPDNVPDGYYTENALQSKISDRVKRAKEDTRKALSDDSDFHNSIFSKYGVSLDEEGKPKGLKPDVDINEIKKSVADQVKTEYEKKLEERENKLKSVLGKAKKSSIIEGANSIGIDGQYLEPLVEGGSPYLIRELEDRFEWNDEINDYSQLDSDGTFKVDGNGFVTASKFFEQNKEKFKHMLKDQRQKGSGFGGGASGAASPGGNPAEWGVNQKLEYIKQNGQDGYKQALKTYKASKRD